jgi:hypothetical protein
MNSRKLFEDRLCAINVYSNAKSAIHAADQPRFAFQNAESAYATNATLL